MTFEIGDKVIYPNHGLGIVERIEDKTILGTTCGFYHLRIVANETVVLVPVTNVDGVGLRRAISDDDVERLFAELKGRVEVRLGLDNTFYGTREFVIRDPNRFWLTFGQDVAEK